MERGGKFKIERLHQAGTRLERLAAYPSRVCAIGAGGGLVVCSADGSVESASVEQGRHVEQVCWSPCGNFLVLGDCFGRLRLFHAGLQAEVCRQELVQVDGGANAREVFRDLFWADGSTLLVLLANDTLFYYGNLHLKRLDEDLRAAVAAGSGVDQILAAFGRGLRQLPNVVASDARLVRASAVGCPLGRPSTSAAVGGAAAGSAPLNVYVCGDRDVCMYDLDGGGVFNLHDVAPLPDPHAGSLAERLAPSPSKRLRLSDGGPPEVVCFELWSGTACRPGGDAFDEDGFQCGGADVALAVGFRRPGVLVLCDAHLFLEVFRWRAPGGADIASAVKVAVPPQVLSVAAEASGGEGARRQLNAAFAVGMCVALASGELLVCAFPASQVLYSVSLTDCLQGGPSAGKLQAVVAAPPPGSTDADDEFMVCVGVTATSRGPDGRERPEMIVSSLRCLCAEDESMDRELEFDENLTASTSHLMALVEAAGPEQSQPLPLGAQEEVPVPRLRRQMELFIERAAQGIVQLRSAPFLRLARHLIPHIPGFIVTNVCVADFAEIADLRAAHEGIQRMLQDFTGELMGNYETARGLARLTDELTRLGTFEQLHAALAGAGPLDRAARRPADAGGEGRTLEAADVSSRSASAAATPRRTSVTPSDFRERTPQSGTRRRHSMPGFREARALLDQDTTGRSLVALLLELRSLEGAEFQKAWRLFRQAKPLSLCHELASGGWFAEALLVFSRHRAAFSEDDAAAFLELLPIDAGPDFEGQIARWVAHEALPVFENRERFAAWLAARAELLEARHRRPNEALRLVGAVLATAAPGLCGPGADAVSSLGRVGQAIESSRCFPETRTARGHFWCGALGLSDAPAVAQGAEQHEKGSAATQSTARLLALYRALQKCAHIRQAHRLNVTLQDLREQHADRRIIAHFLDRVQAPDWLREEVHAHVRPFCEWRGLCVEDALEDYVRELAEQMTAGDDFRLQRAAALLPCLTSAARKSRCLMEMLKRWGDGEAPGELQGFLRESEAWPPEHRDAVRDQLDLRRARGILRKYGLVGEKAGKEVSYCRMPWCSSLGVYHLLSRGDGDTRSLHDALAIMEVFPQTYTRAEAIFLRLSHIAVAAQGGGPCSGREAPPLTLLSEEARRTLDVAASAEERDAAVRTFIVYSLDWLGDFAGGIQECEGADGWDAVVDAWKRASRTLCDLVTAVSRHAAVAMATKPTPAGSRCSASTGLVGDAVEPSSSRWCDDGSAEVLYRLRQLYSDFDLYPEPSIVANRGGGGGDDEQDTSVKLLKNKTRQWLRGMAAQWEGASAVGANREVQPSAGNASTDTLARLRRLGELLGLDRHEVHKVLIAEASAQGLFVVCLSLMPKLLLDEGVTHRADSIALLRGMVKQLCENKQGLRRPADLLVRLQQLEETVTCCVASCAAEDISPLLELSADVSFAIEVLLSSDLLETAPEVQAQLQDLSATHTRQVPNLTKPPPDKLDGAGAPPGLRALGSSFQELRLLIPPSTAMQLGVQYLGSALTAWSSAPEDRENERDVDMGEGGPNFAELLSSLKQMECMELATALLLRHPRAFTPQSFRHLCGERGVRVLRAGASVDNALALAYLGCLEVKEALELFVSSLAYLRTDEQRSEHHRMQRLARLGCDLAVLWGNKGLRKQMVQIERDAKWSQQLKFLGVPFQSSKFFECAAGLKDAVSSLAAGTGRLSPMLEAKLAYMRSLLPRLAHIARFDLGVVAQFGEDQGISREEVLSRWLEACFLSPSTFQLRLVPPALVRLPRGATDVLLLETVLPMISPYDYTRIGALLSAAEPPPPPPASDTAPPDDAARAAALARALATDRRKVLRHLQRYRRVGAPSDVELAAIESWSAKLAALELPGVVAREAAAEARRLAAERLPWHALAPRPASAADGDDDGGVAWAVLSGELRSEEAVKTLLPLASPLGLAADDFYAHLVRRLADEVAAASAAAAAEGEDSTVGANAVDSLGAAPAPSSRLSSDAVARRMHALLMEVRDDRKAIATALAVEERLPLGPERVAIMRCRLHFVHQQLQDARSRGTSFGSTSSDGAAHTEDAIEELQRQIALQESRWDLVRHGLDIFEDIMAQCGPQACLACMYFHFPLLLLGVEELPMLFSAPYGRVSKAATRMGVQGLHLLADAVCARHGLAPKALRHRLLEQCIRTPTWKPQRSPPELEALQAEYLRLLEARQGGISDSVFCRVRAQVEAANRDAPQAHALGHIFRQRPSEQVVLARAACVAQPRHTRSEGRRMLKETREDMKHRGIFLLKIVFSKETSVAFDAKCRALAVIFRIASPQDVEAAYQYKAAELRSIWKTYYYMDVFERFHVPQDFKRFYQCHKGGLAMALWRQHQNDPQIVQVVAALCLDFSVSDSKFWASILSSLRELHLHSFLRDVLVALHQGLVAELPHEPALAEVFAALLTEPADALREWLRAGASLDNLPCCLGLLSLAPLLLQRSPFAASVPAADVARALLDASGPEGVEGAALTALHAAVFRTQQLEGAEEDAAPADRGLRRRAELAALAVEIAFGQGTAAGAGAAEALVLGSLASKRPELLVPCLPLCAAPAARRALAHGIARRADLVASARQSLPPAMFGELVEHAVAALEEEQLLRAALLAGEHGSARKLLALFTRTHGLRETVEDLLLQANGEAPARHGGADRHQLGDDARRHLLGVLGAIRGQEKTAEAFAAFLADTLPA